jgi:hypothetical protein
LSTGYIDREQAGTLPIAIWHDHGGELDGVAWELSANDS